jgi:membrane-bound ClpP family serine protease
MEPWIWSVLLLVTGVAIVALEVFIPSGGVLAVLAGLSFLGSIGLAFLDSMRTGFVILAVTTLVVPVVIAVAIHWWPHTPIGRRILIPPPEHPDDVLPDTPEYRSLKLLVGRRGRCLNTMLPGGSVVIDRHTYDAVSLGMAIEENATVEVVEVRMNRLVVRPCDGVDREREISSARPGDDILSRPFDSLGIEDPLG